MFLEKIYRFNLSFLFKVLKLHCSLRRGVGVEFPWVYILLHKSVALRDRYGWFSLMVSVASFIKQPHHTEHSRGSFQ